MPSHLHKQHRLLHYSAHNRDLDMAAYAALVSLMNTIDQIQNHPSPPISLNTRHLQSLTTNITFLQNFLENYSIDALESRIADAAYAAEDIIESHVVDKVLHGHNNTSSTSNFIPRLEQVIQYLDTIKRQAANVKEKIGTEQNQLRTFSISSGSARSRLTRQKKNIMVGLDDVKLDIMDKLTRGSCSRQTIPIVGMGGIGKTTLARNVYFDSCVKHHFDILAWATVSHEYNAKEILTELLVCRKEKGGSKESLKRLSEHELGEMLYRSLVGRRYLIVLDDMWSVEAWDRVKFFFPDNDNKSRMMITTRLSNLLIELTGGTHGHVMSFLDEDKSWNLLCQTVFGDEEACLIELEENGKKIARNCKGLPLSIVVIGGLLAKSKMTREYWKHIAGNLNSIVKSVEDEHCSEILKMSYVHLPVHLKPCFLYMGMYPQDSEICISNLMKLWIAEGFFKPIASKSFEQAAQEYLNDLIDRNLIFVSCRRYGTKIKYCKIHDLVMELCVREAQKHKFLFFTKLYNRNTPQNIMTNQRRVVVHEGTDPQVVYALKKYSPLVRSFTRKSYSLAESLDFRLMRVWNGLHANISYSLMPSPSLVNCRYIDSLNITSRDIPVPLFWNLQTIFVISGSASIKPLQIWKMTQLRHVKFDLLYLPDPDKTDCRENFILENLQELSTVQNYKFNLGVIKRIPNIKKLGLFYDEEVRNFSSCSLNNIGLFERLESLSLHFSSVNRQSRSYLSKSLVFPPSIKKLTLLGTELGWEDMARKIGCLPNLEILKLKVSAFVGPEWETEEGQFCSLKYLLVSYCTDLERWKLESSHFPCLEQVLLEKLKKLKELPRGIGDIMALRSIELEYCSREAVVCARGIVEEQAELGNEELQARVVLSKKMHEELESLASRSNFHVQMKEEFSVLSLPCMKNLTL